MDDWIVTYIGLPLLIFLARIVDVSIGTIRVIFISKGLKKYAPLLGFIEVLVWIVVIKHIINDMSHWSGYIAYAAGFAAGTYIGMFLEEKVMHGKLLLRVIVRHRPSVLIEELEKQWPLTVTSGKGHKGPVRIIFMIVNREQIPEIVSVIKRCNPKAFYSTEEVKYARDPLYMAPKKRTFLQPFYKYRKGK